MCRFDNCANKAGAGWEVAAGWTSTPAGQVRQPDGRANVASAETKKLKYE